MVWNADGSIRERGINADDARGEVWEKPPATAALGGEASAGSTGDLVAEGSVVYDGKPLDAIAPAPPTFWFRDEDNGIAVKTVIERATLAAEDSLALPPSRPAEMYFMGIGAFHGEAQVGTLLGTDGEGGGSGSGLQFIVR